MGNETATQDVTKPEVNADSSINDILTAAKAEGDAQEAELAASSAENKQETEGAEQSGQDVKTDAQDGSDKGEIDAGLPEGQPIPYDRFKKVNEERKTLKGEIDALKQEWNELNQLLQDADILRAIRKKQGFTDEAINRELEGLGIKPAVKTEEETPKAESFDLNTVEGWQKLIQSEIKKTLGQEIAPIKETLNKEQTEKQTKAFQDRMDKERIEAEKMAKEVYGLDYGDEKNAIDPNTAAGKMMAYLKKHPEKISLAANGSLSKSELLKLALAEDGVKLGERKGEAIVKKRQETVKNAAMEGESENQTEETPQSDWPIEKILAWRAKHPNS